VIAPLESIEETHTTAKLITCTDDRPLASAKSISGISMIRGSLGSWLSKVPVEY
jgi:hypothetical protein